MEQIKRPKSRHLSIYQFFEILQIEWLVADLRTRIAVKAKDKEYWNRVKDGKRQTLENIANRNQLPTILTDSDLRSSLEQRIYNVKTHPNFHYKDENNKQLQGYWDLQHYYKIGAEVRFEQFGEIRIGTVAQFNPLERYVTVLYEGKNLKLPISEVCRIL